MNRHTMFTLSSALVVAMLITHAQAASIVVGVSDPSFELNNAGDIGVTKAIAWNDVSNLGVFDPGNAQFTGTAGDNVQGELIDGGQVGNLDIGRVLFQNLGTAVNGAVYTLDYFHGLRRDQTNPNGDYRVELLEGANTIFTSDVTPGAFGFASAPQLQGVSTGTGTLQLRFTSLSGQQFIDSVSLNITNATAVTVIDPSFELNDAGDIGVTKAVAWNDVSNLGVFDPGNAQFIGTTGNNVQGELVDGGQVGNLDIGRVLEQDLGDAIAGATYFLDYAHGLRRDQTNPNGTYRVELLEGINTIFTSDVTPDAFGFESAPQLQGVSTGTGTLTLRFTSLTGQQFIDDIALHVVAAVPAPAALPAGLVAMAALLGRRCRRGKLV